MRCNSCWQELALDVKHAATACGHLFCGACAQKIVGSSENLCPICDNPITARNIKAVKLEQNQGAVEMELYGQNPETAIHSTLMAVKFYIHQQQLEAGKREEGLQGRVKRMEQRCREQLGKMKAGYTKATDKAKELHRSLQQAQRSLAEAQADRQELSEKLQHAMRQVRHLKEDQGLASRRHDSTGGPQQIQPAAAAAAMAAGGGGVAPFQNSRGPGSLSDYPAARVTTTVHRKQAFFPGASPSMLDGPGGLGGSGSGCRPNSKGGLNGLLDRQMQRRRTMTPGVSPLASMGGGMDFAPETGTPSGSDRGGFRELMGRSNAYGGSNGGGSGRGGRLGGSGVGGGDFLNPRAAHQQKFQGGSLSGLASF